MLDFMDDENNKEFEIDDEDAPKLSRKQKAAAKKALKEQTVSFDALDVNLFADVLKDNLEEGFKNTIDYDPID